MVGGLTLPSRKDGGGGAHYALVTTFFKPLSSGRQAKVTNADTTACSDSTCSEDSESEPEASQSISKSIETQQNCFDYDPQSVQSSNTPEIPKENSVYSGTRSSAVIDGRITDDKLSFTVPRTHDQHPGVFFSEHKNCQKHVRAVTNKSNIKKLLAKGDSVCQISKGAKSKTAKKIKNNRNLIKKFIDLFSS